MDAVQFPLSFMLSMSVLEPNLRSYSLEQIALVCSKQSTSWVLSPTMYARWCVVPVRGTGPVLRVPWDMAAERQDVTSRPAGLHRHRILWPVQMCRQMYNPGHRHV